MLATSHDVGGVIRKSLTRNEFVPFYQPKIDLNSGALVGFEALMRCERDGHVSGLPNVFDTDFPDRGLVAEIGARMTDQILDDIGRWEQDGVPFGRIAINSCAADFVSDEFAETMLQKLANRRISPASIELEVTEGVFVGRGAPHVARALAMLSDAGMRIALDDFGTGYASLM